MIKLRLDGMLEMPLHESDRSSRRLPSRTLIARNMIDMWKGFGS
jgi:hypothetical protein